MKKLLILMILFPLACFGQTRPHWLQLQGKPVVDVRDFGAVGDGVVDDGPALRSALSSLEGRPGVLWLEPGATYSASLTPTSTHGTYRPVVLYLHTGVTLEGNGATIATRGDATTFNYAMLNVVHPHGFVTIRNINLVGNKYLPGASGGEWGMGISLKGSSNVIIENVKVVEQGGDALYVADGGGVGAPASINTRLSNFMFDDNRRQGVSFVSAENFIMDNGAISNTAGTNPQAAINFEPNHAWQKLTNIRVSNLVAEGNKHGILFYLDNLATDSTPIGITVENYSGVNNAAQDLYFRRGKVRGSVNFTGTTSIIATGSGQPFGYRSFENVVTVVDYLDITSNSSSWPVYVGAGNDVLSIGAENLHIKDLTLRGNYERGVYISGSNQSSIGNIKIGVRHIDNPTISNTHVGLGQFPTLGVFDIYEAVPGALTGSYSAAGDVLRTYIGFRHKANIDILGENKYFIGGLVGIQTVRNKRSSGPVDIDAGTRQFLPNGEAGQLIRLTTPESWVTLSPILADDLTVVTSSIRIIGGEGYTMEAP